MRKGDLSFSVCSLVAINLCLNLHAGVVLSATIFNNTLSECLNMFRKWRENGIESLKNARKSNKHFLNFFQFPQE